MKLRIVKILNNNAFISKDENDKEIIIMGKGIAFQKKSNEEVEIGDNVKRRKNWNNMRK